MAKRAVKAQKVKKAKKAGKTRKTAKAVGKKAKAAAKKKARKAKPAPRRRKTSAKKTGRKSTRKGVKTSTRKRAKAVAKRSRTPKRQVPRTIKRAAAGGVIRNKLPRAAKPAPADLPARPAPAGALPAVTAEGLPAKDLAVAFDAKIAVPTAAVDDDPELTAVSKCLDKFMDAQHHGWADTDLVSKYKYDSGSIVGVLGVVKKCLKPTYTFAIGDLPEKCTSSTETILQMKIDIKNVLT